MGTASWYSDNFADRPSVKLSNIATVDYPTPLRRKLNIIADFRAIATAPSPIDAKSELWDYHPEFLPSPKID